MIIFQRVQNPVTIALAAASLASATIDPARGAGETGIDNSKVLRLQVGDRSLSLGFKQIENGGMGYLPLYLEALDSKDLPSVEKRKFLYSLADRIFTVNQEQAENIGAFLSEVLDIYNAGKLPNLVLDNTVLDQIAARAASYHETHKTVSPQDLIDTNDSAANEELRDFRTREKRKSFDADMPEETSRLPEPSGEARKSAAVASINDRRTKAATSTPSSIKEQDERLKNLRESGASSSGKFAQDLQNFGENNLKDIQNRWASENDRFAGENDFGDPLELKTKKGLGHYIPTDKEVKAALLKKRQEDPKVTDSAAGDPSNKNQKSKKGDPKDDVAAAMAAPTVPSDADGKGDKKIDVRPPHGPWRDGERMDLIYPENYNEGSKQGKIYLALGVHSDSESCYTHGRLLAEATGRPVQCFVNQASRGLSRKGLIESNLDLKGVTGAAVPEFSGADRGVAGTGHFVDGFRTVVARFFPSLDPEPSTKSMAKEFEDTILRGEEVTVVAHSQGTVSTRNAISLVLEGLKTRVSSGLLSAEDAVKATSRIRIIAAGAFAPMKSFDPKTEAVPANDPRDPISILGRNISLREMGFPDMKRHFFDNYIEDIKGKVSPGK